MIRNIIFDMGGVICSWDPQSMIKALPIDQEHGEIIFRELFYTDTWVLFDAGVISEEEVYREVCDNARTHILAGFYGPWDETPEEAEAFIKKIQEEIGIVLRGWTDYLLPIPGMEKVVKALREAGYRTYLLSNASVQFDRYRDRIEAFRYMDGLFVSGFYGLIKPDHRIYETFLKEFGLVPEECVFIEDSPANIAGSRMCGIRGIVFGGDINELWSELGRFGVRAERREDE